MARHQVLGHLGTHQTFARRGGVREVLGEWSAIRRTVDVQIFHDDQLGSSRCRTGHHSRLQWREQLWPFGIGRVETEVDRRRVGGRSRGELFIGGVTPDRFHTLRNICRTRPVDRPDSLSIGMELLDERQPDGAGPKNHMKIVVCSH